MDPVEADCDSQTEFELNHAISFAHYAASLPADSPHIPHTLPRLKQILRDLLDQAAKPAVRGAGSASGSQDNAGTGRALGSTAHAKLVEALLKASLWAGWANEELAGQVAEVLEDLLHRVAAMMKVESSSGSSDHGRYSAVPA